MDILHKLLKVRVAEVNKLFRCLYWWQDIFAFGLRQKIGFLIDSNFSRLLKAQF